MIFDLHCDTVGALKQPSTTLRRNSLHFDLERAVQAGIVGQFFALFSVPGEADRMLRNILLQINCFLQQLESHADQLYLLRRSEDYETKRGRIAAILHLEGADCLHQDLELVDLYFLLGVRSLSLTWNPNNLLAGGAGSDQPHMGLSPLGRALVQKLANMPMLLDLSHLSEPAFYDILDLYPHPLLVTHSNVWSLCPHPRNLKDEQLALLAENGGIIGINQVKYFIRDQSPDLEHVVDHMVYVAEHIGVKHLALGSDFDGAEAMVLHGVEEYPLLMEALSRRGFTAQELKQIGHENVLRIIRQRL